MRVIGLLSVGLLLIAGMTFARPNRIKLNPWAR